MNDATQGDLRENQLGIRGRPRVSKQSLSRKSDGTYYSARLSRIALRLWLNCFLLQSVTAVLNGNFPLVSTLLSLASLHPGSFKRKASGWSGNSVAIRSFRTIRINGIEKSQRWLVTFPTWRLKISLEKGPWWSGCQSKSWYNSPMFKGRSGGMIFHFGVFFSAPLVIDDRR